MSVSEINFCIQCGNSVTGSKYCSKCGNEVASTTLFEKDKESDDKDAIDKLFKELKNKKKQKIKEAENLYNNDKISLDELPKKPSKDSSNNTKYKWVTFIFPAVATFIFHNSGILLVLFIGAFSAGFCLLLAAVLTFLTNKRESLWKLAFVLSIFVSFILVVAGLAKMNMENSFFN